MIARKQKPFTNWFEKIKQKKSVKSPGNIAVSLGRKTTEFTCPEWDT